MANSDLEIIFDMMVRKIYERKSREIGVQAKLQLSLTKSDWGPPIVGENVYGEAFPFEKPPKIWLEVFIPDAEENEITETICHELIHVKRPEIKDGDPRLKRLIRAHL